MPEEPAAEGANDDLPPAVVDEAERLTRLARGAVDGDEAAAYRHRRETLLAEHGYTARVRDEGPGDDATLVCHPTEWLADGVVQLDAVEDLDRGVERRLEGPGDEDWETVVAENEAVVERIERKHDEPHVATARSLADFANNHYAKPIAELTPGEVREFETEYFPRNAWPSDAQTDALDGSLEIIFEEVEATSGDPP